MYNFDFRPELYGSELAAHLSKILNTCKNDDGIASSLALEGLRYLCTGGVIDIVTAWETLAPSFETENRENVIQRYGNDYILRRLTFSMC